MEEFIEKFSEFRDFLNSPVTEHSLKTMLGKEAEATLKVIKDKFEELGLNNAF